MASIDRYRPPRERYRPPSLPPKPVPATMERLSRSPSRRRDVPPAVPSPPAHSSRTSPPRPLSQKSAPSPAQASPVTPAAAQSEPPVRTNQWLFTPDEIVSTPSVIDGLSPAEERVRRAKGVNFIVQAGIAMRPHAMPQVTLYVAAVFFHRFYMRASMVEEKGGIHHYNVAATALFLANKTEENCCKTKNMIIAVAKVAQKNLELEIDEQSKEYWRWRDSILTCEELMLEILTFDLMVGNPYEHLWHQLRKLGQLHCKPIREAAWTFINDSALTTLPLMMEASDIAMAAIFFACTATKETIEDVDGQSWWHFLRGDEDRMSKAIDVMVDFYLENPLKKQNSRLSGSPKFCLDSTRRRMLAYSPAEMTPLDIDRRVDNSGQSTGPSEGEENSNDRRSNRTAAATAGYQEEDDMVPKEESQTGTGDSDGPLKEAANNLGNHGGKPNGLGPRSPPLKRKSAEPDMDLDRTPKRPRRPYDDEGDGGGPASNL